MYAMSEWPTQAMLPKTKKPEKWAKESKMGEKLFDKM